MSLKQTGKTSGSIEQPAIDAGVYPARLVQIIDFGLQPQRPYQGVDKKPANEINLTYELTDSFMVDKDGKELPDKPRWIGETLPWYGPAVEKSKSAQRYKALDPNNIFNGDISQCVDTPVNVTIVLNESKGKSYANVAAIAAMRPKDAQKCPDLVNPSKVFDLDAPDLKMFYSFPEWIQTKIQGNLEYSGSKLQALIDGKEQEPVTSDSVGASDVGGDTPWD